MTNELDVWFCGALAGRLSLTKAHLHFFYLPEWLNNPKARALSCGLPLRSELFNDEEARPFFAGLLPEGRMRQLLAKQFHVSNQNDFALLDSLGGECAGAVAFLKSGQQLPSTTSKDIRWLSDEELVQILMELPHRPMLAGKEGLRLSLAGAQDKLPVVVEDNKIGLPLNGTPSSHILKPAINNLEGTVVNEFFCLLLADAVQLNSARVMMQTVHEKEFLLVERYDRSKNKEKIIQRLHQEDFCQALSVVPEMKYQNEGGPRLAQCFDLIRRVTKPNAPEIIKLLDYVIFNSLIGNHDAHAKNFSLLYLPEKPPILAPLYDTLSTVIYPSLTEKMAMKIGSKYKFSEIQARHWDEFAQTAGLSVAQTRKRIIELAKLVAVQSLKLQSNAVYNFAGNITVEKIVKTIEQRVNLTIQRLSKS
jgi:serine/threonine-protein kinase HipA